MGVVFCVALLAGPVVRVTAMDTTKPPIPCSSCGEPIWPADLGLVMLNDEPAADGMYEGRAYHKTCSPPDGKTSADL